MNKQPGKLTEFIASHSSLFTARSVLTTILLVVVVVLLLALPSPLPPNIGDIDLRPYWSSAYLLARGQDFGSLANMDNVERTLTGWTKSFTMSAWFAPTGNLVLIPFTFIPFERAAFYWLLVNIAVILASVFMIWQTPSKAWVPLVTAFGFSMTLLSLIYGQMNTLEVLGLALFLFFSSSKNDFVAGIGLALTTIKPHLVILTLPLLLLDSLRHRQWRVLAGFFGVLTACALVLFILYPAWVSSFWQLVSFGMSTIRETPTLTGLLVITGETTWGKWLWVGVIPLAILIWWKRGMNWDRRTLIDVSLIASLLISPIGWSYDQIILLFPIFSVLEWMVKGMLSKQDCAIITITLFVTNAVTFYERVLTPSEVWFFWVPIVVAGVYAFAYWRRREEALKMNPKLSLTS